MVAAVVVVAAVPVVQQLLQLWKVNQNEKGKSQTIMKLEKTPSINDYWVLVNIKTKHMNMWDKMMNGIVTGLRCKNHQLLTTLKNFQNYLKEE